MIAINLVATHHRAQEPGSFMAYLIHCRVCLRKNEAGMVECAFCGASLLDSGNEHTTLKVALEQTAYHSSTHCAEYFDQLEDDTFALFVMEQEKPLVVQNAPRIILGRMLDGSDEAHVNFPDAEALELGVSRRHAQISYKAGQYHLMDFHSTNGTWLNRKKLNPNVNYLLHSGDIITLGRLRLLMCTNSVHQSNLTSQKEVTIHIVDRRDSHERVSPYLTPHYLGHKLVPYLQAIADLQYVINQSQGEVFSETWIRSVQVDESAHIVVQLTTVHEAIAIIKKWVIPWRETIETNVIVTSEQNLTLNQLADAIMKDVASDVSEVDRVVYVENLLPALTLLANSELILTMSEQDITINQTPTPLVSSP